ncbi:MULTISPECIES: hypothetical protein [Morganellaceae]|uniref:DUF3742 family protein n=1 Tax=Morganella morganii TaxID=582 RepID=A0A8I0PZJ0_MORMO|nr:hypothetical protein [Morganella morganii]MBE8612952.1 hypothetical protein [Morganella morganii]
MSDKTTSSRGERWGIKLAHGTKWGIRSVKKLDRYCIEKAKEKSLPVWLGHLPKLMIITSLIIIAFFSLLSFFILFFLYQLSYVITPDTLGGYKVGHYEMDGYHYPDGSIDHNDK